MAEEIKPEEPIVSAASTEASAPPAPPLPAAQTAPTPTETLQEPEQKSAEAPAPEPTPTLLQQVVAERDAKAKAAEPAPAEPAKEPAKPAEAKAADADKPAESEPAKAAEPAKPEPVEYKYTLPETLKLDDARKADVHKVFDAVREGNVQAAIDFHAKAMADYAAEVAANNQKVFLEMRAENRKRIMGDPELGGSGHQTVTQAVARMRDFLVPKSMLEPRKNADGSPRMSEADEFFEYTGAGDHPVLWHILHNAARYLDEPQAQNLPANPRPTKVKAPKGMGSLYTEDSRAKMNGQ